ncbi:unnamed protein product, partial [Amoebophrya sp. A120]
NPFEALRATRFLEQIIVARDATKNSKMKSDYRALPSDGPPPAPLQRNWVLLFVFLAASLLFGTCWLLLPEPVYPSEVPAARKAQFSGILDETTMYIFSGRGAHRSVLQDLWSFDFFSKRWKHHRKPSPKFALGFPEANGDAFLLPVTGRSEELYSPDKQIAPTGRFNGCHVSTQDGIFIFGGDEKFYGTGDPDPNFMSRELWVLTTRHHKKKPHWQRIGPLVWNFTNATAPSMLSGNGFSDEAKAKYSVERSAPACSYDANAKQFFFVGGRPGVGSPDNELWVIDVGTKTATPATMSGTVRPLPVKGACAGSPRAFVTPSTAQPADFSSTTTADQTANSTFDNWVPVMYLHGGRNGNRYSNQLLKLRRHTASGIFQWEPLAGEYGVVTSGTIRQAVFEPSATVTETHGAKRRAIPPARNHHACTYIEEHDQFWVFGGRSNHRGNDEGLLHDLWGYSTKKGLWHRQGPRKSAKAWPTPRFLPSFEYLASADNFLVFAGQDRTQKTNDIWLLSRMTHKTDLVQPCEYCD